MFKKRGRLVKRWSVDLKDLISAPPLIFDVDGDSSLEIIVPSSSGKLFCLDSSGKTKWVFSYREKLSVVDEFFSDAETAHSINTTPVFSELSKGEKSLIVGTEQGRVLALTPDGKKRWEFKCEGSVRGGVAVADVNDDTEQEVFVGSSDGFLYMLTEDGRVFHKFDAGSPIESPPVVVDNNIIFGCNDGTVYCLSPKGDVLWSFKTHGKIVAKILPTELYGLDRVYLLVGSKDGSLYVLDSHGNLEWSFETDGAVMSSPVVFDSDEGRRIVFGSCDNRVYALNDRGDKLWDFETDFWVVASPVVLDVDGDKHLEVVAGSYDHNVYVLDSSGDYVLDFMPGVSGVLPQSGHYGEILTQEAGTQLAKRLWQLRFPGVVSFCGKFEDGFLVVTRKGVVSKVGFER